MATSTSNLGLQKPDYSDAADIAVLNGNSDKIDSSVNATDGAIAIVSNGNTHPAIPSGNYVYIRGHSSLSEGLYKNSTSGTIGVNATLSTSNVSAISSGGMNEMKSITDALNSNIASWQSNVNPHKNTYSMEAKNALSNVSQNAFFDIRSVFNAFNDVDFTGIGVIFCRNNAALGFIRAYHPFGENAVSTIAIESGKQYDMIIVSV